MNKSLTFLFSVLIMSMAVAEAQNKIVIPDTDNHLVLTGDMHLHTVFSDGNVWTNTRVDEAYSEGVEEQCEDVPRDMRCYTDSEGNIYDFAFGLNWKGQINDKRVKKYY